MTVQDDELDEEDESFTVELSAPSNAATPLNATFAGGGETLSATATIADDDATPAITSGAFEVAEGQTVVGQLAATDDDHAAAELAWSIPAGSAGGADAAHFTLSTAGALAFAAAKDHENPDDANTDRVYALTVQVSDGANAATADLTVTLTDVAPAVSIAPVAASVEEGTAAAFTLTRSGDLSGTQAAIVAVTETGAVLATGQAGERQVTFADGATEAALNVATDDDTVAEAAGTVTATVQTGTAHVTVTDNDAAALTLTVQPSEIAESDAATAVTVTAAWDAGTRAEATAVTVSVGGGSATSGTDYTAVESFTLTIAATESTGTRTFTLTPKQDSVSEGDETIDVTGSAGDLTVTKAEMTLTDDETAPGTIALTTAPTSVGEDDSATAVRVTATLGGNVTLPGATEVTVSVGGGSATSGTDYTAVESFTLTIAATESTGTGTFTLTPKQDSVSEGDETIDVTGSAGDLTVTKAEMMLTDDETAPTAITLTTAPASVREDDSATAVTVTATLDGNVTLAGATAVTVSVGGGSATSGTDYTAVEDFTLTIAATESTGTGTFTLTPTQDNVSEGDETIDVTGSAGDITVTKAEMTLTDDETAPTIALTTAPTSVGEDDSATQVTVTATLGGNVTLPGATEVTVSVGGGTAASGTDYTAVADITLTIAATESTGTGTFTLTPKQDSVSEGSETIDVTGSAGDLTVTKATMTLTDDETAPTAIALTTAPASVREDDSATAVTVTATLDGNVTLAGATAVTVSVGGGSATSGTDYTAVEDFTLTIAATESTGTGTFTLTPTQDNVSEGDETIDVTGSAGDITVTKATMTLTDDEAAPGTIALTTAPTSVGEDDSATAVTVTATLGGNVTLPGATEVTVSVGGGTAASGTDYTAVESFTLTIAATESTGTGTFTLTPKQDSVSEGDETIDVTGSAGDLTVTKAEMMLTDDETAPTAITLTTAPASVREDDSATAVTVTATLDGNVTLAGATAVTVSVGGGSATSGTDYTAVEDFTLTIAATESTGTGTFTLTPTQDNVSEGDETIDVTGSAGDITVTKAEMTLTDDETAPTAIALTTAPTSVGEDDSATQVTVTATLGGSVTLAGATEVAVSVGGGTATSGTDYTAVESFTLTIAATESSGTGTFTLTPKQDSVSEGDETIDVTGSAGDFTVTKAEMTLTDDETAPGTIALTTDPTSVREDDSATAVRVTATLGGNVTLPGATEVTVSVAGGSATSGTDYTAVESFTLTIAATESTGTGTFTLTPKQDTVSEGNETIDVTGSAGGITVTKATMTLTDDETAPTAITLTTVPTSVREDDSATAVTVTATLDGNVTLAGATAVTVSVGGGSATSGTDYTAVEDFTLTIAATESTGTGTFTLTPTQDNVSEGDETIDVTGSAGDITVTKAEMTLTDDETAPTAIALTTAPTSVGEDDSATQVTVTATLGGSVTLAGATEVAVSVGGGTATSGTDYTAVADITLTIAATESSGTGTFTLTPKQDSVSEGDETIDVTGTAGDITVTKATMTLTDDETAPGTIALTTAPTSVGEDDSATQVTVTATLGGNVTLPGATEVTVSVGGGTAASGTDYTAVADITLTIAATESTGTGTFTLTPKQDSVSEGSETIDVTGSAGDLTVTKAEMMLTDDETAPTAITLTTAPASVREDDSATAVTVTATLDGNVTLAGATAVTVSVGGGSATSGTDYTAVEDFTLTIAATESTGTGTFTLTPTQDNVSEGDETIDVTGSAGDITVTKAEMTLTDDETAPTAIALTTAPTSVGEDDSATQVTVSATLGGSVTLAGATEVAVSVGGGTATSGTDYTAVADITLTIAATESSGTGTFTLTPKQDSVSEGDETIDVTGTAGDITVTKATMTLTDDETAPGTITLTTDPTSVGEDASETEVTVTATLGGSVTLSSAIEVTVSVGGGTATSGTDYTAVADFTFTIAATESSGTGTFMLTPTQDSVSEGNETIDVTGTAGDFTVTKAEMTLTDDETAPGTITLTTDPTSVGEDASETEVRVIATLGGSVTLSSATEVTVSVGGGTATSGTDYTAVADFTFTIAATESTGTGTFMLTPTQDSVSEGDETIDITGAASGFTVTKAEMTLTDDETASTAMTLSVDRTEVAESSSGEPVEVTATLDGAALGTATDVTVSVTGGTATAVDDFAAVDDVTVTIAAGEASGTGTFTLAPVNDDVAEADETVTVSATTTSDLTVTPTAGLTVTITDDDERGVRATPHELTVPEGGTATYEVKLTSQPTDAVDVTVTASGDATVDAQTLSFTTEDWSTAQTVTVTGSEDADSAAGEATIAHVANGGDYVDVAGDTVDVTVTDDDQPETQIALELDPGTVPEGAGVTAITVTARLSPDAQAAATEVTVSVTGDTATAGADFAAVAPVTLTIAAGQTTGTASFTLTPVDDAVDEADETLAVSGVTAAPELPVTPATLTLGDDDERGVTVKPTLLRLRPGEHKSYTVRLSSQPTATAKVRVIVPPGRIFDLTVEPATLTFTPATWQTSQTVTVTAGADSDAAASGTRLELRHAVSGGDYDQLPAQPVAVSLTGDGTDGDPPEDDPPEDDPPEDDPPADPPTVSIAAAAPAVEEGAPARFTLTRTGAATDPRTVAVTVTERGRFIAGKPPAEVTFAANARTAALLVPTADDATDEPDGAVTATLAAGAGYETVAPVSASVTIRDNDRRRQPPPRPLPPPPVTIADAGALESAGEMEFTVRLGSRSRRQVTVNYATTAGTATRGADYARTTGTLTFRAGALTRTLAVPIVNDLLDEADESFAVVLSGARHARVARARATGTIADDDAAPELTIGDRSAVESAGQMEFTVELSAASGRQVTVSYATLAGTAAEGVDYTRTAGALTFEPGALSRTLAVPIVDDAVDEADETFAVRLSDVRHATPAGGAATLTATGTIVDDDEPAVSIAADAAAVAEGQAASFTVTRVGVVTAPLTVTVEVTESGAYVVGELTTQVTIEAGAHTAKLLIATADDGTDEPDGTVTAALAAGGGYVLVDPVSASVTVTDDDAAPELSIADTRAVESAGQIEFTVRMAAASGHRVTVTCASADGTATAEEDYEPELGTLVLEPGQTVGKIRLAVLDDTLDELDETFTMVLADPVHATLPDGTTTATGTIEDDDASLARAWLARFGRTVASHVVEAVDGRLREDALSGGQATVAGRPLSPGREVARSDGVEPTRFRTLEFRELLNGSTFHLALSAADAAADDPGADSGGRWTAWGRGGATQLSGVEGDLSVGGAVATGVVGADYELGRLLTGLSVAYSGGGGEYTVRGTGDLQDRTGELQSWLLSAHPYASVRLTDRLQVWGLAGYGLGRMSLAEGGGALETDIALVMGAFGGRGVLLSRVENGAVDLTLKSDGLILRVSGEETDGLPEATAEVSRVRLLLEGSVDALRGPAGVLTPSLQVGGRYDGGAAETGAGLEVGGGLSYAYPAWGLRLAANGRLLLTHQDRDYEEWGAGGSLRLAPGAAGRGPSLSLDTSWGDASSSVEQLWSQGAGGAPGLAAEAASAPAGRLAAELSYGLEVAGGGGVLTPYAGMALADGGACSYRLGGRFTLGPSLSLSLQGDRREGAGHAAAPVHGLTLSGTLRW